MTVAVLVAIFSLESGICQANGVTSEDLSGQIYVPTLLAESCRLTYKGTESTRYLEELELDTGASLII